MKGLLRSSPFMILCNRIRNFVSHTRGALHGTAHLCNLAGDKSYSQPASRKDAI